MNSTEKVLGCAAAIVLVAGIWALMTLIEMKVWNWLDNRIFHLHQLTFWEAAAIAFIIGVVGNAFRATVTSKS